MDEKIRFRVPESIYFDENSDMPMFTEMHWRELTLDEFLENYFFELCKMDLDRPPFEIWQDIPQIFGWQDQKQLCPTALIDTDYGYVLDLYETADKYKVLPSSGGIEDQNPKVMAIFRVLSAEINRYEKIRMENLKDHR